MCPTGEEHGLVVGARPAPRYQGVFASFSGLTCTCSFYPKARVWCQPPELRACRLLSFLNVLGQGPHRELLPIFAAFSLRCFLGLVSLPLGFMPFLKNVVLSLDYQRTSEGLQRHVIPSTYDWWPLELSSRADLPENCASVKSCPPVRGCLVLMSNKSPPCETTEMGGPEADWNQEGSNSLYLMRTAFFFFFLLALYFII